MKKVRFGIIGVGNMGTAHAESLFEGKVERATLTCLCDISEARREVCREKFPEIPVFETADELIASGLADAVLVAVPHYDHSPIAVKAFEAGLAVVCEKPAGVTTKAVLEMNEAAKKSGKAFGMMFNQRTSPAYSRVREMVRSGELGKIKRVQWTITDWYRSQAYHDSGSWRSTWGTEGGGALINQNPHQLDLMQWMFGMPSKIMAHLSFGKYRNIEVEDEATLFWEYEDGMTVTYITSTAEAPGTNRLEIACDMGRIVIENNKIVFNKLKISEPEFDKENTAVFGRPEWDTIEIDEPIFGTAHVGILNNFVSAMLDGTPMLAPGLEGINEMTISNACHYSAWTGKWADVKNFPHDEFQALLKERIASSTLKKTVRAQNADTKGTY